MPCMVLFIFNFFGVNYGKVLRVFRFYLWSSPKYFPLLVLLLYLIICCSFILLLVCVYVCVCACVCVHVPLIFTYVVQAGWLFCLCELDCLFAYSIYIPIPTIIFCNYFTNIITLHNLFNNTFYFIQFLIFFGIRDWT
jgi:hypothetical protein